MAAIAASRPREWNSQYMVSPYWLRTGTAGPGAAPPMSEMSSVQRPDDRAVGAGAASDDENW